MFALFRPALRGLFRAKRFSAVTILTLALGATRRHVFHLVLNQGLKLTVLGILIGLGCAWGLGRFLTSLVYETSTHDPILLFTFGSVLLVIALAACLLPAIRATRVNIARLLRAE